MEETPSTQLPETKERLGIDQGHGAPGKTSFANLGGYAPAAVYFAGIRIGGKIIRRALKTTVLSAANPKLFGLENDECGNLEKQMVPTGEL